MPCSVCGREGCSKEICPERHEEYSREVETGADLAYLDRAGPHRCDLCGGIVQTRDALASDCPHGENGGASA